jgi:predicted DNA binding protein
LIQLQFLAGAESWVEKLCHEKLALIKVIGVKPQENQREVTHFVDISSQTSNAEDISREIKASTDVTDSDLARVGTNRVIGSVTSNDCVVCKALFESKINSFIAPAITGDNCQMSYKVYISGPGLPIFLQRLHKQGVEYKISDLSPLASRKGITARQQKVLRSALELGYYDFPKKISTEQLAGRLGIKAGTVAEILRRAEKNVITSYFEVAAE